MPDEQRRTGSDVIEQTDKRVKEPALFRVILHNDHYTTMDFVVQVLETVFHKTPAEAYRIMMKVHTEGRGLCGLYPYDIAETKVVTVHEMAQENGFPLRASMEEE